ncbi:MAG: stage V sporulation protein AD [Angelakisella sp.]
MARRCGKQTLLLDHCPVVLSWAAVGAKREGEGPFGQNFDQISSDGYFEEDSWEKAESKMQKTAVTRAIQKAGLTAAQIELLCAGDLLNQCIGSTYGLRDFGIPFLGLYGACSTMAESLGVASLFVEAGFVKQACAVTSSHFCSAERQFRFPLEYGSQRPPCAQWTATASGSLIVADQPPPHDEPATVYPRVKAVTLGCIKDMGITDANNMGAAMAPAAADTLRCFFADTGMQATDFDGIFTGDLGAVGSKLLLELLEQDNLFLAGRHHDCGLLLYDRTTQQVDAGGSGCGCSAAVLCTHLLPQLAAGVLHNILFIATGALMSPTALQQGESIPGIAHLVWLSSGEGGC